MLCGNFAVPGGGGSFKHHPTNQWRSQDFLKEESEVHGGPKVPQPKTDNSSDLATIFGRGVDELKRKKNKEKRKMSGLGPILGPRRPSLYLSTSKA